MPDKKIDFEELGAVWSRCEKCYIACGHTWTREQLILWEEGIIWCPMRFIIEKDSIETAVEGINDGSWKCRKAFWKTAYGKPDCDEWIEAVKTMAAHRAEELCGGPGEPKSCNATCKSKGGCYL